MDTGLLIARLMFGAEDTSGSIGPISGGCFTAIVAPDGTLIGEPINQYAVEEGSQELLTTTA